MADEHDRTWLTLDRACHGIDIVRECAQGILHGDDAQALDMQQRNHFAPARRVGPSAVDDHHCRSLAVTRHGRASSAWPPRHFMSARRTCLPALSADPTLGFNAERIEEEITQLPRVTDLQGSSVRESFTS